MMFKSHYKNKKLSNSLNNLKTKKSQHFQMTTTQKTENKDKEVKKPREQFTAYKGRIPYLNCTWWETITFGWCKPFID